MAITARPQYDSTAENEVFLELLSYSGGENTVSEDHVTKANEARINKNWEASSLGGMRRARGFNEVASQAGTDPSDLAFFHYEDSSGTGEFLGVIDGDLVKKDGTGFATVTGGTAAFTSGVLCHAASGEDETYITNSTDNLYYYDVTTGFQTPSDQPATACDRIYRHKNRLIAEGGGVRIYGSVVGAGNWSGANAWTTSGNAWNLDLPDATTGLAVGYPNGDVVTAFTERGAYILSGFPNTRFDRIPKGRGCSAPYSIAVGDEGVYFLSKFPTLGVFLWDGTNWNDLTKVNEDAFVDKIDFSKRIFGIYRDRKYYLIYNELNSGVTYPNRMRVFNAQFGRWMEREVNPDLDDTFGYPALLTKQNNELYVYSSQKEKIYELETTDDSDEGNDTEANWKTKDFTARDWSNKANAGLLALDESLIKITKVTVSFYGTTGVLTLQWTADRGRVSGSQTIDLTAYGDLINTTFTVNSSYVVGSDSLGTRTKTVSIANNAVGRSFNFQLLNNGTSTRPIVKKIKFHGIVLSED